MQPIENIVFVARGGSGPILAWGLYHPIPAVEGIFLSGSMLIRSKGSPGGGLDERMKKPLNKEERQ